MNKDHLYLRNKIDYFRTHLELIYKQSFSYEEVKEAWRSWSADTKGGWMHIVPFVELKNPSKLLPYLPIGRDMKYTARSVFLPPMRQRHHQRYSWSRDQF